MLDFSVAVHIDRLPKVLTVTGSFIERISSRYAVLFSAFRAVDADSCVVLRPRMIIRVLITPWTRRPQARPFRQLLLANGLVFHALAIVQFEVEQAEQNEGVNHWNRAGQQVCGRAHRGAQSSEDEAAPFCGSALLFEIFVVPTAEFTSIKSIAPAFRD